MARLSPRRTSLLRPRESRQRREQRRGSCSLESEGRLDEMCCVVTIRLLYMHETSSTVNAKVSLYTCSPAWLYNPLVIPSAASSAASL